MAGQRVRDVAAIDAMQVHVEHGAVEGSRLDLEQRILDRACGRHVATSELVKHVLDHHQNHSLILDDEDPSACEEAIHWIGRE